LIAANIDINQLTQVVGPMVALLLVILYAGSRGIWVYGRVHQQCEREKEEWKEAALTGTMRWADALGVAQKAHDHSAARPAKKRSSR
jgi:hypothetical protein